MNIMIPAAALPWVALTFVLVGAVAAPLLGLAFWKGAAIMVAGIVAAVGLSLLAPAAGAAALAGAALLGTAIAGSALQIGFVVPVGIYMIASLVALFAIIPFVA